MKIVSALSMRYVSTSPVLSDIQVTINKRQEMYVNAIEYRVIDLPKGYLDYRTFQVLNLWGLFVGYSDLNLYQMLW